MPHLDDVLEAYNLIKDLEPTVPPVRHPNVLIFTNPTAVQ
jgi:hypothetical protein